MTAEKVKSGRGLAGADVDYWIQNIAFFKSLKLLEQDALPM